MAAPTYQPGDAARTVVPTGDKASPPPAGPGQRWRLAGVYPSTSGDVLWWQLEETDG